MKVVVSLVSFSVAVGLALSPSAGAAKAASYNCKGDKQLDSPMDFSAVLESPGRLHLSASDGADKSNYVAPNIIGAWRVYDAAGKQVTQYTDTMLLFASAQQLTEVYVEGLTAGSYTVDLTSADLCGNQGHMRRSVTIPAPGVDSNLPQVSGPRVIQVSSLGATAWVLNFSATDDTAIKHVALYIDGNVIVDYRYFNGTSFRWWTGFYPDGSSLAALEGPTYYVGYPDSYKGQTHTVEVVGDDLAGNRYIATVQLALP
jgi:hypothetical protein